MTNVIPVSAHADLSTAPLGALRRGHRPVFTRVSAPAAAPDAVAAAAPAELAPAALPARAARRRRRSRASRAPGLMAVVVLAAALPALLGVGVVVEGVLSVSAHAAAPAPVVSAAPVTAASAAQE